jgi:hypothetical protein
MTELCVEPCLESSFSRDSTQPVAETTISDCGEVSGFAEEMLRHLDAAYNLARWLVRNSDDAEDIVRTPICERFAILLDSEEGMRAPGCSGL